MPTERQTHSTGEVRDGQPPKQWVKGAVALGVKRPGHEADYSLRARAEVKNSGSIHLLPHTPSLVKHTYFTLTAFHCERLLMQK
jgi:hypothetical protein